MLRRCLLRSAYPRLRLLSSTSAGRRFRASEVESEQVSAMARLEEEAEEPGLIVSELEEAVVTRQPQPSQLGASVPSMLGEDRGRA